ncbi:ABC exporter membrane fusion protein [Gloeothece verrucosa]|uniref:ABC exporter membrane fusion protein, DevB family n=1 Tax=Gloeothece verrucosa (strain PCC 7822) TaxID=497965 RepID=E0U775_GLOV7|nr:ABC exporter membrane fusion protein [Gloeothece verrucosa]ADN12462.1 ABC exporter membrane fusion protein, DevB family [Gloeothece verrucosa PCC 7822]
MTFQFISKPSQARLVALMVAATSLTGAIMFYAISQLKPSANMPSKTAQAAPTLKKVAALGRLEPYSEVVSIAAPLNLDGDRVAQLLVKQGDRVKAGQIIAILDSRATLENALAQATQQVKMAQAKLAQVKAGAKTGEIQAQQAQLARIEAQKRSEIQEQQANIARLEAEKAGEIQEQQAIITSLQAQLANAEIEDRRHQLLYQEGAISASVRDAKHLAFLTVQQELAEAKAAKERIENSKEQQLVEARAAFERIQTSRPQEIRQAQATLNEIAEVRPVDVQVAQTEVDNAIAAQLQAKTNLEQANIRAPMDGQILKIHTRPGAKIGDLGLLDMAQTDQMVAVAEVYQTDIGKIRLGQRAIIKSQAFAGQLQGTVSEIGLQVNRQNVFSNQPGENLDRRVIEVKVRLNPLDSKRVSGLTNLQVEVVIQL